MADGAEVIELGTIWKMTEDVEPNWEIRHGWHIVVDGMPTVRAHVAGWPPGGRVELRGSHEHRHGHDGASHRQCHPPRRPGSTGVVTYKDLPLVTAARRVHPAARP